MNDSYVFGWKQLTEFMLMTLTYTSAFVWMYMYIVCFKTERDRDKYRQNSFIDCQWITINGFFLVCGFFETFFFFCGNLILGIDFSCSVWILRFVTCCSQHTHKKTNSNGEAFSSGLYSEMRNAETVLSQESTNELAFAIKIMHDSNVDRLMRELPQPKKNT